MKNSSTTPANTVATTSTTKAKAQSMTVATIKAVVCVPHIILQSSADLLMIGEAKLINVVDGTPMLESIVHRTTYTQEKMAIAANKVLDIQAKLQAKLDSRKQQDINKLKTALDKLEGVEHVAPTPDPKNGIADLAKKVGEEIAKGKAEPTVPTPVVEAPFVPINKRPTKSEAKPLPLMTPKEAFVPAPAV